MEGMNQPVHPLLQPHLHRLAEYQALLEWHRLQVALYAMQAREIQARLQAAYQKSRPEGRL
jgi:hypothetical protein